MSKRTFAIKTGVRRNYGKHEIYFEIAEQVEIESTGQLREAYLNLQSLLDDQIKTYEALSLPHVSLPSGQDGLQSGGQNSDTFVLETIKIEFADGKKRVKACGGKYLKHGVPVYEECKTQLPIETLSMGIHDFRHLNLTVKVDIEGGKPKRAYSIS